MTEPLRIVAIVGPTATGKTRLAVELAHRLGSQILSADSRQVYRGLDIGAGKDLREYAAVDPPVPHHLIDVAEPGEVYTLFDFQRDAFAVLRRLAEVEPFSSGNVPVVMVGGSGLYVEAVLRQFELADVAEDPGLRRRLGHLPIENLRDRLRRASPDLYARTDVSNRRRLIRGLEIAAAAANGPVASTAPLGVKLDIRIIAIDAERGLLRSRISARLAQRLEEGLIDEVRGLVAAGLPVSRLEQLGLEYRAVGAYLRGRTGREEMVRQLTINIGRFAKRQQTWFRGMSRRGLEVHWISPGDLEAATAVVRGW